MNHAVLQFIEQAAVVIVIIPDGINPVVVHNFMFRVNGFHRGEYLCQHFQHVDDFSIVVDVAKGQAVGKRVLHLRDNLIMPDTKLTR